MPRDPGAVSRTCGAGACGVPAAGPDRGTEVLASTTMRSRRCVHDDVFAPWPNTSASGVEGGEVIGRAPAHQDVGSARTDLDLFVDPGVARILDIGAKARPRRQGAVTHAAGSTIAQGPWQITATGATGGEEAAHEGHRRPVPTQLVCVGHTAGQDQGIEFVDADLAGGRVRREDRTFVEVVECLPLAARRSDTDGPTPAESTASLRPLRWPPRMRRACPATGPPSSLPMHTGETFASKEGPLPEPRPWPNAPDPG